MSFGSDPSLSGRLTTSAICVSCSSHLPVMKTKDHDYGASRIVVHDAAVSCESPGGNCSPSGGVRTFGAPSSSTSSSDQCPCPPGRCGDPPPPCA